jgi:hypothetical protein
VHGGARHGATAGVARAAVDAAGTITVTGAAPRNESDGR